MRFCHQNASREATSDASVDINLNHLVKVLSSRFSLLNGYFCKKCHRMNSHIDVQDGFRIAGGLSVVDL